MRASPRVRLLTLATRLACRRCWRSPRTSRPATGRTWRGSTRWATSQPGLRARSQGRSRRSSTPRSTPPSARFTWPVSRSRRCCYVAAVATVAVVLCTDGAGHARRSAGSCASAATTSRTPTASRRPSKASPGAISVALVRAALARLRPLRRSRSTGSPTSRSASRSPRRRYLGRAIRGPLEDLYPDVELHGSRRRDQRGAKSVVRLKKRRPFVLSIQTTRNYEHAFAESLVALLSAHDHETTVQLVLTPAPGFDRTGARAGCSRSASARSSTPTTATPANSASTPSSRPRNSRARSSCSIARCCTSTCASCGATATTVRRVAGLFSQLRSENELGVRYDPAPPAPLRAQDRERRCPTRSRAGGRGCSRPPSWRRSGSCPRARVKHARLAARDRPPRDRAAGDRARRRPDPAARRARRRSRSRPTTASTDTRSSVARAAARAR